jgi:hypothetical protein
VLTIEEGEMGQEEIIQNLKRMFDKEWQWKLKPMDEYRYMVRFPPTKRVQDIAMGDVIWFPLSKEGVMASLKMWDGEIKPIGKLKEAWVQVRGIPPKWSEWGVFQQIASSLGKLVDVDWYSLFSHQFAMVKLKIKCKDPCKIPTQRVLEIKDELYLLTYKVEEFEQNQNGKETDDGGDGDEDPDNDEEDDLLQEDLEDLNRRPQDPSGSVKDKEKRGDNTPKSKTSGGQSGQRESYAKTVNSARKSIEKMMDEGEFQEGLTNNLCGNLLKAMELEEREEGEEEQAEEIGREENQDQEMVNLPDEWIYAMSKEEESIVLKDDVEEDKMENTDIAQEEEQLGTEQPQL